jgi:beta-fructofuranosidase
MTATEPGATYDRPDLHLSSPDGWLNDPLAITYRQGRYHAFYQSVPQSDRWRPAVSWGAATSPDLLHWTAHPPVLGPGDGDLGCWSGDVVVTPDDAVAFYTSVHPPDLNLGRIRSARPADDGWLAWQKGPAVVEPPDGEDWRVFRDPSVFRDGPVWRMLVGAGHRDGRAAVLSFTSGDLEHWDYAGPCAERPACELDPAWTATAWECPHLVRFGDRHVLLVSVWAHDVTRYVAAGVGTYADGRMQVQRWSRLTYGCGHDAASPFVDADGQQGLVFWIRDVAAPDGSWTGAMSLPYRCRVTPG